MISVTRSINIDLFDADKIKDSRKITYNPICCLIILNFVICMKSLPFNVYRSHKQIRGCIKNLCIDENI